MDAPYATDPISALREGDAEQTDRALEILSTVFGYDSFRGEQAAIIDHVARGGDAVVLMPTGGASRCATRSPRCCARARGSWSHR